MTDIQKCILRIYKEVALLCEREGIHYYAIGGTCIGAVRHKGFIPWDDDLDIAIPIEEFDTFIALAREKLPPHLEVYTYDDSLFSEHILAKIVDKNTTLIEESNLSNPDLYRGCFVDIMPLSGVPDEKWKRFVFCTTILFYFKLTWNFHGSMDKAKGLMGNMIWIALRPLKILVRENYFEKKWMDLLRRHPVKNSKYVGDVWVGNVRKKVVLKECFGMPVQMPFEDTIMKCPQMWDQYLTKIFGNYMELPPQEERHGMHSGFVDLHRPYQYYRENPDLVTSDEIP